jgi:hypothetical protein
MVEFSVQFAIICKLIEGVINQQVEKITNVPIIEFEVNITT